MEKLGQRAIVMSDYGSTFFTCGGVPPVAFVGAGATGKNVQRALADVHDANQEAKKVQRRSFRLRLGTS